MSEATIAKARLMVSTREKQLQEAFTAHVAREQALSDWIPAIRNEAGADWRLKMIKCIQLLPPHLALLPEQLHKAAGRLRELERKEAERLAAADERKRDAEELKRKEQTAGEEAA
jgi:hypothetical protein